MISPGYSFRQGSPNRITFLKRVEKDPALVPSAALRIEESLAVNKSPLSRIPQGDSISKHCLGQSEYNPRLATPCLLSG